MTRKGDKHYEAWMVGGAVQIVVCDVVACSDNVLQIRVPGGARPDKSQVGTFPADYYCASEGEALDRLMGALEEREKALMEELEAHRDEMNVVENAIAKLEETTGEETPRKWRKES